MWKKTGETKEILNKVKDFRQDHNSNRNIFLVCFAIVMIWRWLWNLLDIYLLPNKPFLSNLICIVIWVVILLIDDWMLLELIEKPYKLKDKKE